MTDTPQNDNTDKFDTATENEIKKIELSLVHGIDFSQSYAAPDINPETEGAFLNYIEQWEQQYALRKTITIYELLGKPVFAPVDTISDEDIAAELDDVMNMLKRHSVQLNTLCPVPERVLYKFVTEEFLEVSTTDIRIEGMMHAFIYEDFYPNHEYDIQNRCDELVTILPNAQKGDMTPWELGDEVRYATKTYTKKEFHARLIDFRTQFDTITLKNHEYLSISVNETENDASVVVHVHYEAVKTNGENRTLMNTYRIRLQCTYQWWTIYAIEPISK